MRKKIYNYYVISARFDGNGHGFAIGMDNEWDANFVAYRCLLGFASVITDYQLEGRFPQYYHNLISKTS